MSKYYTGQTIRGGIGRSGRGTPTQLNLPWFISEDRNVQENFEHLQQQLNELIALLSTFVDLNSGTLVGNLANTVQKVTEEGLSEVTSNSEVTNHVGGEGVAAGTLASKNSVDMSTGEVTNKIADNITESATKGWIHPDYTDASRRPNIIRKTAGDVAADTIIDTNNNDQDDLVDGTTYARVLAAILDSGRVITIRKGTAGIDVDVDDVFDVTNNDLADVPDDPGGVWRKVAGVDASNLVSSTSVADDVISAGSKFGSAVQLALADYNTDTGPGDETEWEAV